MATAQFKSGKPSHPFLVVWQSPAWYLLRQRGRNGSSCSTEVPQTRKAAPSQDALTQPQAHQLTRTWTGRHTA